FFATPTTPATAPLSLHDALPIYPPPRRPAARRSELRAAGRAPGPARGGGRAGLGAERAGARVGRAAPPGGGPRPRGRAHPCQRRSEEHTSELQSRENLVCRLLLE